MSQRRDSHREATLFAPRLPEGGTIGVPAPSNPYFNRSDVLRGVEWWESRGYRVKLSDGMWERDDYVAGDAKTRANDITAMFADPDVHVVQSAEPPRQTGHGGRSASCKRFARMPRCRRPPAA